MTDFEVGDIRVESGNPTPEDAAAAIAVVAAMLVEGGAVDDPDTTYRWAASVRKGRASVQRGDTTWAGFTG
ncbi:acyl-CoA carboxylase epsilon subunit-like protein [Microbacteriaceae bacterium MWH-Ta3]|nr:acyl-CoA carboxylase epsilon subunit-like protein [Microbacteriaceae bacterium MWH-Ta3]